MDDKTRTDKMLSRKEGGVGYMIFNNPERHNAVSLEMWAATTDILEGFRNDPEVRVVVVTGAGGKAFVSGADISKFESERSSMEAVKHYNVTVGKANADGRRVSQADHRDDQGLLHRRRARPRALLRHAHRLRQFEVRRAGGEARARLCLSRPQAAGRRGRSGLRQGDLLHRPAVRLHRGARDGPDQPRGAGRRARELRQELRRYDRGQRAADAQGGEVHRRRDGQGREPARPRALPTSWSRIASPARTTSKAARPSWRSANPFSRGSDDSAACPVPVSAGRGQPRRQAVADRPTGFAQ